MKSFIAVCALALSACGLNAEVPKPRAAIEIEQAQLVADNVANAILNSDVEALHTASLPVRLQQLGATLAEQKAGLKQFIETQRPSLVKTFGDKLPTVIDIEEKANGSVALTFAEHAKPLYLFRVGDQLFYPGLVPVTDFNGEPTGKVVQASETITWWYWHWHNYASTAHKVSHSAYTDGTNGDHCTGCGSTCVNIWHLAATSGAYGTWHTEANLYNAWTVTAKLMTPNTAACTCGAGYGCTSSCCASVQWGDDYTWASNDTNSSSLPYCNIGYCP